MIQRIPFMQSVAQYYPFSTLFSFFSSFTWTGLSLYSRSPYTMLPAMQTALLLYGLVLEFKRLIPDPVKIKNNFKNREFYYNGQLAAILKNENNSTPSLEIYSADPAIIGLAMGNLLGNDYLELRRKYSPFLFLNAQARKGPILQNAIKTINQKTRERGIDVEYRLPEFHHLLLESNKKLIENNLAASSVLQDAPITIDELDAYNRFPNDIKGNLACSVYIPAKNNTCNYAAVSNFDWPGAGDLFNRMKRLNHPTGHTDSSKPQFVISFTLPTHAGFRASNGHILLMMNEVETSETMRKNPDGGFGQFDLFNKILQECCTRDDIEECIKANPPASPYILIAVTKNGSFIIELLPSIKENSPLYRIIEADQALVATNHFQGLPGTATISCSLPRWEKMMEAIKKYPNEPWKIAAAAASKDTGQTLIAKWQENGDLIIQWNIANYNSAIAIDPDTNAFNPDELNVTQYGKAFLRECEKHQVKFNLSSTDQELMELYKSAYQVNDEEISQSMRDLYSQLMFEKSKLESGHPQAASSLTMPDIENIARDANNIVKIIMDKDKSHELKINALKKYQQLNHGNDRLLFALTISLLFAGLALIAMGPSGFDLARTGLNYLTSNLSAASAIYFASAPLRNALKSSPDVAFFKKAVATQLERKLHQETKQHVAARKTS